MDDFQAFVAKIPKEISEEDRISIGQDIIEFIQRRAIDKNTGFDPSTGRNKKFPKYTKAYAEKKGSARGDVDLVFSADMFNAMEVLKTKPGQVIVGFDPSSDILGKVEGNHLGTYGQSSPISGKARPFLGLTKKDLAEIISNYVD